MTDIPWERGAGQAVLKEVKSFITEMGEDTSFTTVKERKKNAKRVRKIDASSLSAQEGEWAAACRDYLRKRSDLRETTLGDSRKVIKRFLEVMASKPAPGDGPAVLKAYTEMHLQNTAPGGEGRRRNLQELSALLRHCVEDCGMPSLFLATSKEKRRELVGMADRQATDIQTPPLKPEQLIQLLEALEADKRWDLYLAVGLVALFGLRPAELANLRFEDGQLRTTGVKRNRADMNRTAREQGRGKERILEALEPVELEGLGDKLAHQWASGLIKLPPQIQTAIEGYKKGQHTSKLVGNAFAQYLRRYQPWRSLVASTPGLTPYSLRHGFAWQAHLMGVGTRWASSLMGHDHDTHLRYYGNWTDETSVKDAVAAAKQRRTAMAKLSKVSQ
ncbi:MULTISPECIES: tyrosine-type recombinase/integrase [unclassified Synechococcus]|uniref:tyrosine-type recombinase/integrase n=1 Tax=unclassified Synechococcus TaxID=2626047 RepID=UPI0020016EC6|nr:tyrosine-type recombinase/integrase [Synechococcus sp. A10-1-5-1]UPM49517.1 tyrosine-type recombinase/integrase [Synechococcus sp. A10-1-5-1]